MNIMKLSKIWEIPFLIYFWLFNLALLFLGYLGLLPFVGTAFIMDALAGELPLDFFLPLIGLVAVPTTSAIMGRLPAYRQPISLIQVFYGVEAPLLILCVIRFMGLRQLNPAVSLVLITGCLAIGSYLYRLIKGDSQDSIVSWMQLACQGLMLVVACYLGALTLIYAIPLVCGFFVLLGSIFTSSLGWVALGQSLSFLILYAFPIALVLVVLIAIATTPFGLIILYLKSWRSHFNYFASRYGGVTAVVGTTGVIFGWICLLLALQQQPQTWVLKELSQPVKTPEARQALLQKSPQIRTGLLNAYLSQYRYLESSDRKTGLAYFYQSVFKLDEPNVQAVDNLYKSLFKPFLYQGKSTDSATANKLYAEFFDTPIIRAEKAEISEAVGATFNRGEAKAGLLDINQKKVWLQKQEVKVKPQNDWANVEIHEVYENKTFSQQEVVYSFSLPESAAITGVWLGNNGDRSQAFPFTVSPRGAAQKVYTREVNRRIDPALLEQIGPGNYRLRAFPVVPNQPLHLWVKYQAMQQNGKFPLPQLSEKRNIFWTQDTKRTYNGKSIKNVSSEAWFPEEIGNRGLFKPESHQVNLANYRVTAKPLSQSDYRLPQSQKLAVVLDTSYSMGKESEKLQKSIDWLRSQVAPSNDVDLYITASQRGTPQKIDDLQAFNLNKVIFYGNLQPYQMLQQFTQLQGSSKHDAIILITDKGSYELSDEKNTIPKPPAPLWMVHLGGIQPAYDDPTFDAIQASGGGVGTEISQVMQRMATKTALGANVASISDGYVWEVTSGESGIGNRESGNESANTATKLDDFAPFAARQAIAYLSTQKDLKDVKNLDEIHALAKRSQIVTPYSSMIVLIDDRQRQALKDAEKEGDRFNRQVEDKQLPQPTNNLGVPNVTATPEPREWMLIGISGLGLGVIAYRRRLELASYK
jgi:putative PEP-CTERM system integral membrane protein